MKAKTLDLVYWNSPPEERIPVALLFFKKTKNEKKTYQFEMVRSWSNSLPPGL